MAPYVKETSATSMRVVEEVKYRLHSTDGREFTMDRAAAHLSGYIKQMVQDLGIQDDEAMLNMEPIVLDDVYGAELKLIVEWCEKHKTMPPWEEDKWWLNERDEEMKKWERDYMENLTSEQLCDLMTAAEILDIKCLLDRCGEYVAGMIKGRTVEEIQEIWKLGNDFATPEEEEQARKDIVSFPQLLIKPRSSLL